MQLDDGWRESVEEQNFFISMKIRYYNQYIENMLGNRKEEYQKDIAQIQTILCSHTEVFFTQTLSHTKDFFHTKLLHTKGFTHKIFNTQTLLHTKLSHADPFTHGHFYTETLLPTDTVCCPDPQLTRSC